MTVTDPATSVVKEIDIKAPAAKVFAALTDPEQIVRWWGTEGSYRCTHMEADLRVGGAWRTRGIGKDGDEFVVHGEYLAIDAPRLLEYSWHPSWGTPHDTHTVVRIELQERDGGTHLTLTHTGFSGEESRIGHDEGWTHVLDLLVAYCEDPARSG